MSDEEETAARVRIDYDSGERVYLRIVRIIRDMIISGELPVGTQVPSGAQMKRRWGADVGGGTEPFPSWWAWVPPPGA